MVNFCKKINLFLFFTFDLCTPNMMQLYINTTFSQNNSFNKIPKCRTSGHSKNKLFAQLHRQYGYSTNICSFLLLSS